MISSISCAARSIEAGRPTVGQDKPRRQIYGRKTGPRLRAGRKLALAEGLETFGFALPRDGSIDLLSLFGGSVSKIWLEIGFGGGEHLLARALAHPEVGFIGVEPFVAGVAQLVAGCRDHGVSNVRVLVDDARLLLRALPDAAIERAFILFPDPWPKTRHHKRRIVNLDTIAELARVMRPGGVLELATDDPPYSRWMLAVLIQTPQFAWLAERSAEWRQRPADGVETRYARKALAAGRMPVYLQAERVADEDEPSALRGRGF